MKGLDTYVYLVIDFQLEKPYFHGMFSFTEITILYLSLIQLNCNKALAVLVRTKHVEVIYDRLVFDELVDLPSSAYFSVNNAILEIRFSHFASFPTLGT